LLVAAVCWAHKLRNLADKVPKKEGSCVREAAAIYQAANRRQAQRAYRACAEKWREQRPRAVASLERDLHELLNFFAVPRRTGQLRPDHLQRHQLFEPLLGEKTLEAIYTIMLTLPSVTVA
jgi:transposase-like protein